jgi:hypothetical protein
MTSARGKKNERFPGALALEFRKERGIETVAAPLI